MNVYNIDRGNKNRRGRGKNLKSQENTIAHIVGLYEDDFGNRNSEGEVRDE